MAKVAVATTSEIRTVTALPNHALPKQETMAKAKDATKKANPRQQIVPPAIASLANHAATAEATITPHVPATKDKTTKRMRKTKHLTNKPTSIYKLTRLPSCFKIPSELPSLLSLILTLTLPVGGRVQP